MDIVDNKFNWKKILDEAIFIGKRLLENGAEVHRVELTIEYICKAYGATRVDVFAIPSMIIATAAKGDEYYTTKLKRIKVSNTDLYKIEQLNKMSRYICENLPSVDEINEMIKSFDETKRLLPILKYIGVLIGCFGFSIYFGGSFRDGIAAGIAAFIMSLIMFNIRHVVNKLLNTLFISAIGGLLCVLLCKIHIGEHITFVMIGAIMLQIPGMALSYSFRDLMMDDLLSGMLRFLESILTAVFIVIGFSAVILVSNKSFFVLDQLDRSVHPIIIQILTCSLGCLGFAFAFNINYKYLWIITIGAALTVASDILFSYLGISVLISTIFSAAIATLYCEIFARVVKAPVIVFLVILTLVLVPGAPLYYTMNNIWLGNMIEFYTYLLKTFYICFGIGIGIVVVMFLRQIIWDKFFMKYQRKRSIS